MYWFKMLFEGLEEDAQKTFDLYEEKLSKLKGLIK